MVRARVCSSTVMVEQYARWIQHLTPADNMLYFTADDGVHGMQLWALPLELMQRPEILGILAGGTTLDVTFACDSGAVYSLKWCDSPPIGNWQTVPGQALVPGEPGGVMTLSDSSAADHRYYCIWTD